MDTADPNILALHRRIDMDALDILEAFEKAGWTLVALSPGQFRWETEAGGKSSVLTTDEAVVDFARDLLTAINDSAEPVPAQPAEAAAEVGATAASHDTTGFEEAVSAETSTEALPEMPGDLADAGWTFERDGEELYAVHEELVYKTSHNQTDPAVVIAEAYRMQENYERKVAEAEKARAAHIDAAPPRTSATQLIHVDIISLDGGTQMRVEQLNLLTVTDYAEQMRAGARFPPVDVFFDRDEDKYWLADGFQRVAATKAAELEEIQAVVHEGTLRDAILFAVGANAHHGLPRTNADKRRAVEQLLYDDEWRAWTDARVADAAGVSAPFVKTIRDELTQKGLESPAVRINKAGRAIDTTRIGDREAAAVAEAQPELPGAVLADAPQQTREGAPYVDDTRAAAAVEMADPDGSLELESNAHEEEGARRNFDPVNEANAEAAAREERRARFAELLDALRDKPNGMKVEELLELGISHEQIEDARRLRLVEKHVNGRIFYQWHPEDIVAAIRKHGPLNRFQLEDEMGCQLEVINTSLGHVIQQRSDGAFTLMEPTQQPVVEADEEVFPVNLKKGHKIAVCDTCQNVIPGIQIREDEEVTCQSCYDKEPGHSKGQSVAQEVTPAAPVPSPETSEQATGLMPLTPESKEAWAKASVVVTLKLLPDDGHGDGRRVLVVAHEEGGEPITALDRDDINLLALGGPVRKAVLQLINELPTRLAKKPSTASTAPATASPAKTAKKTGSNKDVGKKSAAKRASKTAPKKGAAKKSTGGKTATEGAK